MADRTATATAVLLGAFGAVAVMVGQDGTAGWQVVRVAAVVALAAIAVVARQRGGDRARGWLAVVVGLPVLAAGIGFLPYIVEQTVSIEALAALGATVCGVALVVTGTIERTRGRRLVRRLGAGLGTLVVAALAVLVIGPAVAATNVPPTSITATPPQVGLAAEDVTIDTADGVELAGWYVPSTNRAAVVLLHGAGSTRSSVLPHAAVLADHGFGVLLIDARGHGDSDGRAMDFGWHGDADVAAATRFLARRDDVDRQRIGVVGLSLGGEVAIGASASDRLIAAVVAEGATARTAADKAWLSDEYGIRGLLQEQIERLQHWITDGLTDAAPPVALRDAVARTVDTPYLLISAGTVADERLAAEHIAGAAPDRVERWDVDGAAHTQALAVARDEWEARVTTFLSRTLAVTAPASDAPVRGGADRQQLLDDARRAAGAPGVLAVVRTGGTEWSGWSGAADQQGTVLGDDSTFRIASITKSISAALTLDAVQRGLLDLDDPVGAAEANDLVARYAAGERMVAPAPLWVALAETHDRYFPPGLATATATTRAASDNVRCVRSALDRLS